MRSVRGKDNKSTERRLRAALIQRSIAGWTVQPQILGRPDFFFDEVKLAVFVDGCFWHADRYGTLILDGCVPTWQCSVRHGEYARQSARLQLFSPELVGSPRHVAAARPKQS